MIRFDSKYKIYTIFMVLIVCLLSNFTNNHAFANLRSKENKILKFNSKYPDEADLVFLPKCCTAKRREQYVGEGKSISKQDVVYIKKCRKYLGPKLWTYYHHYCAGLMRINRYYQSKRSGFGLLGLTDLQQKTLRYAIGELTYAESHYIGYPQYITAIKQSAIAWWELGQYNESFKVLKKGIKAMPKHPALYMQLAEFLVVTGNKSKAIKILEKGLISTNGNKNLKTMLSEIK